MLLYEHQKEGIAFLKQRPSAALFFEMGTGKTRCALVAAKELFAIKKIDRVVVLCPAATRISWAEEIEKLNADQHGAYSLGRYDVKKQEFFFQSHEARNVKEWGKHAVPVTLVSYALLPQDRHVKALSKWCFDGNALLICDESSFLKSRTAKQTKGSAKIAENCVYRWLLTGTPIANSPLDLYGQALVMSNGNGPLKSFKNFYHFRSRYATTQPMRFGGRTFQQVTGYQNLDELTAKFAPYVLRRTKTECLDLPAKSYVTREVQLTDATWKIYQELRRDALLSLPDEDVRPEPNAAVRILRLCQLTSGHVGADVSYIEYTPVDESSPAMVNWLKQGGASDAVQKTVRDISSEKLSWLVEQLLEGELADQQAVIIWCRWRRERERLAKLLREQKTHMLGVYEIFGGQSHAQREANVDWFQKDKVRHILLAQPHAGGFGLNLTAASTAIFLSNDFSHTTRVQAEDRIHRIGQNNACLYVDVVAVGPRGQRTVDHHVLDCLHGKRDLAEMTCSAWRRALENDQ